MEESRLVELETAFEDAKAARLFANITFKAAKGKYHTELMALRAAGRNLTSTDMQAMEDAAIDTVPDIQKAYLDFVSKDGAYRKAKIAWESAKRQYWDSKGIR